MKATAQVYPSRVASIPATIPAAKSIQGRQRKPDDGVSGDRGAHSLFRAHLQVPAAQNCNSDWVLFAGSCAIFRQTFRQQHRVFSDDGIHAEVEVVAVPENIDTEPCLPQCFPIPTQSLRNKM